MSVYEFNENFYKKKKQKQKQKQKMFLRRL